MSWDDDAYTDAREQLAEVARATRHDDHDDGPVEGCSDCEEEQEQERLDAMVRLFMIDPMTDDERQAATRAQKEKS